MSLSKLNEVLKGGAGSGFHGHSGRKGKRGGASPGKGGSDTSTTNAAKKKPNLKKLTIQQASSMLAKKGYKLGQGHFDLKKKITSYEVTKPNGNKQWMTVDEIKEML